MKILNIVSSAYRATLEEQDDTILWLSSALRGAGAAVDVLLTDAAVQYAVRGQEPAGLNIAGVLQTEPPQISADIQRLLDKDARVFVCWDDLTVRGIGEEVLLVGLEYKTNTELPKLFQEYDAVWHW